MKTEEVDENGNPVNKKGEKEYREISGETLNKNEYFYKFSE